MTQKDADKFIDFIFNEEINAVKELISKGADVNFINDKGSSPLLVAIENQNEELVKLLLENGADPNLKTDFPSLHLAIDIAIETTKNYDDVIEDNLSIIILLLEFGADINTKDYLGRTALDFAKDKHIPAQKLFEKILQDKRIEGEN